ncbi:MAG: AsmA family protein [Bdellovibrionales bacterium]|nr:AsmA family protein [Bdellovibrionales bacterium]
MKKKIFLILGLLVAVALGAVFALISYVATNANSLIEAYSPQLEQEVSEKIGMPVSFGKIDASLASFTPSLTVREPNVGGKRDPKIHIQEFRVRLSLWDLLSKKLTIDELTVVSPSIELLKDKDGIVLPSKLQKSKKKDATAPERAESQAASSTPIEVNLKRLSLEDGSFVIRDQSKEKPDLDLRAIQFSAPVLFKDGLLVVEQASIDAVASELGRVSISTRGMTIDSVNQLISLPQFAIELDPLGKLETVGRVSVAGGDLSFSQSQSALTSGAITISSSSFGKLVVQPTYSLKSKSGELQIPTIQLAYQGQEILGAGSASVKPSGISLDQLALSLLGGKADLSGSLTPESKRTQGTIILQNILLQDAVKLVPSDHPIPVTGTLASLQGTVSTSLSGNPLAAANGKLSFQVKDGSYTAANIAQQTLGALLKLPFIGDRLFEAVPEEDRTALNRSDTPIERLGGDFVIGDNGITTENFELVSPLFLLRAKGRIGFDQQLSLRSSFIVEKGLSLALASKAKELRGLMSNDERMTIPVAIRGAASAPQITPDTEEIMKLTAGKALEEKAKDFLGGVLKGKKGSVSGEVKPNIGSLFGF